MIFMTVVLNTPYTGNGVWPRALSARRGRQRLVPVMVPVVVMPIVMMPVMIGLSAGASRHGAERGGGDQSGDDGLHLDLLSLL
jgi:hypothetical protein